MSNSKAKPPLPNETEIEAATRYIEEVEAEHAAKEEKKILEMPMQKGPKWKN